MNSTNFYCPHCRRSLSRDAAAPCIAFGSPTMTCPACRGEIDSKAIIAGVYDRLPGAGKSWTRIVAYAGEYWTSTVAYAKESWTSIVSYLLLTGVTLLLMANSVSFFLALLSGFVAMSLFEFVARKVWK